VFHWFIANKTETASCVQLAGSWAICLDWFKILLAEQTSNVI